MGDTCYYFGEFKLGKKNGIGTYKWIDDSSYEGEIKNNLFDGYGIYKKTRIWNVLFFG